MIAFLGGDSHAQLVALAVEGGHELSYCIGAPGRKLRFILGHLPRNRFATLDILQVFPDGTAVLGADMVDEKLAVQVVHLVQDGPAEQPARVELERAALERARLHGHPLRTRDVQRQVGKTQAALVRR